MTYKNYDFTSLSSKTNDHPKEIHESSLTNIQIQKQYFILLHKTCILNVLIYYYVGKRIQIITYTLHITHLEKCIWNNISIHV